MRHMPASDLSGRVMLLLMIDLSWYSDWDSQVGACKV